MPINDAARACTTANFLPLTEREECSCGVHALLCTTPSNLSTPLSVLFSSELAHASGVWTERCSFSPSRAQHVRRCPLEVALVPVSAWLFLSLCLPSSSSVCAQGCCQSNDLCKSAAKLPGASCVRLCACACTSVCMCWWSHATLSTHVLKQGYGLRLAHFGIELSGRQSRQLTVLQINGSLCFATHTHTP